MDETFALTQRCSWCLCECHCDMVECPNCPNDVCTQCQCSDRQNRFAEGAERDPH